jgi:hypothetical protein
MSNTQPELPKLVRMNAHLMQVDRGDLQIHAELEPPTPSRAKRGRHLSNRSRQPRWQGVVRGLLRSGR